MAKKPVPHYRKRAKLQRPADRMPTWLLFLAYLAYLRAMQPQRSPEVSVLRLLIIVTALVLIALALVAAGDPSAIPTLIQNWHL